VHYLPPNRVAFIAWSVALLPPPFALLAATALVCPPILSLVPLLAEITAGDVVVVAVALSLLPLLLLPLLLCPSLLPVSDAVALVPLLSLLLSLLLRLLRLLLINLTGTPSVAAYSSTTAGLEKIGSCAGVHCMQD
jgi:hypothetical protein